MLPESNHDIRQKIISEFLLEIEKFEQTAARTIDRNELDPIEERIKRLLYQLKQTVTTNGTEEN